MKKLIFTLTIAFILNGNYSSQCVANEIPINQALKVETADLLVSHAANVRNYIEANPELLELTENEIDSIIYNDFVNTVFGSENDYISEMEYLDSLLNLLFDVYQISPTAPNRVNQIVENLISEDYIDISSYPPCTQAYMVASLECLGYTAIAFSTGPGTAAATLVVCQSAAYAGFCACLYDRYNGGC